MGNRLTDRRKWYSRVQVDYMVKMVGCTKCSRSQSIVINVKYLNWKSNYLECIEADNDCLLNRFRHVTLHAHGFVNIYNIYTKTHTYLRYYIVCTVYNICISNVICICIVLRIAKLTWLAILLSAHLIAQEYISLYNWEYNYGCGESERIRYYRFLLQCRSTDNQNSS